MTSSKATVEQSLKRYLSGVEFKCMVDADADVDVEINTEIDDESSLDTVEESVSETSSQEFCVSIDGNHIFSFEDFSNAQDVAGIDDEFTNMARILESDFENSYIKEDSEDEINVYALYITPSLTNAEYSDVTLSFAEPYNDIVSGKLSFGIRDEYVSKLIFWLESFDIISSEFIYKYKMRLGEGDLESIRISDIFQKNIAIIKLTINNIIDFKNRINITTEEMDKKIHCIISECLTILSYRDKIKLDKPKRIIDYQPQQILETIDTISLNRRKNSEPYSFFISAENQSDKRLKFLDYYHVVEYFFYGKLLRETEKLVGEVIQQSKLKQYNLVDNHDYYLKIRKLFSRLQDGEKNLKELTMFQDLLNMQSIIGFENLKNIFNERIGDFLELSKKTMEIAGTEIELSNIIISRQWKDNVDEVSQEKFLNQLAQRLYKIRNYIVHSTKYKVSTSNGLVYAADLSKGVTEFDLELVRVIAYLLLISDMDI